MDTQKRDTKTTGPTLSGGYVFNDLLSTHEREFLVKNGQIRSLKDGDTLCQQNEVEESIFVVLTGEIAIVESVKDKTIELGRLRRGDIVGEISALFSVPRIASAKATKQSVVLEVSGRSFNELLIKTPILQNAVYQRLYERSLKTALQTIPKISDKNRLDIPGLSTMLQCWNSSKIN